MNRTQSTIARARWFGRLTVLGSVALLSLGCSSVGPWRADLSSADANERILAIRAAAEARDLEAVPLLVDRLEDEDSGVRFYAILALEKLTGRRFDYDYAQPSTRRAAAVERWREFVRRGEHVAGQGAAAE